MNDLEKAIRKYKLDDLLFLIAEISRDMYQNKKFLKDVIWKNRVNTLITFRHFFVASDLVDLSYYAIKNSNDYRSVAPTEEDVYQLNNILLKIIDEDAKRKKEEINKKGIEAHILLGLPQKQFWYQDIIRDRNIYYNFLRYYILLSEIPSLFPEIKRPNDDLIDITGFNIKNFSQLLMAVFAYNHSDLNKIVLHKELTEKIPILTETNIRKMLHFFSADYKYYRQTSFPNNPIFFKPIIETDTHKLIISNAFIWAKKVYEGIFWIIRDKHLKENSQTFTNGFGKYYEGYVQKLLDYYLKSPQYEKIKKSENEKRADWLIYTKNYILIIEQKSCLMIIALKKEYPSLEKLDDYLENFKKAYTQLAETEKMIGKTEKKIVKLVLHFEKFFIGETLIKERVSTLCKDEIKDFSNYFFIDTEEFERLIQILADDEESFNKIMETKFIYEASAPISVGKEFSSIIDKNVALKENRYLESHKNLFDGLFENL